jgi:hypothetical protein
MVLLNAISGPVTAPAAATVCGPALSVKEKVGLSCRFQ